MQAPDDGRLARGGDAVDEGVADGGAADEGVEGRDLRLASRPLLGDALLDGGEVHRGANANESSAQGLRVTMKSNSNFPHSGTWSHLPRHSKQRGDSKQRDSL